MFSIVITTSHLYCTTRETEKRISVPVVKPNVFIFRPRYILLSFTSEHKDEVKAMKSRGQKTSQLNTVSKIPIHI